MARSKILFRASGIYNLLAGGNEITDKQLERIRYLQARDRQYQDKAPGAKELTDNMKTELEELIAKRNAPFEFGQQAKTFIEDTWLQNEYGYKEELTNKEILKGHLTEIACAKLLNEVHPAGVPRILNRDVFTDNHFRGKPDIILPECIEDIKSCWDKRSFFRVRTMKKEHYAQGQVYMALTKIKKFKIRYCLVPTPNDLLLKEDRKIFYALGGEEDNEEYERIAEQMYKNHAVDHIDPRKRIKTFEFDYEPAFIKLLRSRVVQARKYYKTIRLNMIEAEPSS